MLRPGLPPVNTALGNAAAANALLVQRMLQTSVRRESLSQSCVGGWKFEFSASMIAGVLRCSASK